jgi:hypothetical protein
MMDRQKFFAELRSDRAPIFGKTLSPAQVSGISGLLDVWAMFFAARHPFTFLAAALGQVFRETGGKMQPILETYAGNRKQAAERLERAFKAGKLQWVKTRYWLPDESGQIGVGGGFIQETHRANYVKADARILAWFGIEAGLSRNYDMILDPAISALAMFTGMIEGSYRGKKLADYQRGKTMDYKHARDIVNGDTKHVGDEIERNCLVFERALLAAGADREFGPAQDELLLSPKCIIRVPERFAKAGGTLPGKAPAPAANVPVYGPEHDAPAAPAAPAQKASGAAMKTTGGFAGGGLLAAVAVWFKCSMPAAVITFFNYAAACGQP